jgi:hypothetical protein
LQNEAIFGLRKGAGCKTASGTRVLQNGPNFRLRTAALGFEFVQLAESIFHRAVQALFADAEIDESLRVVAKCLADPFSMSLRRLAANSASDGIVFLLGHL